jgi:hypothetical protein
MFARQQLIQEISRKGYNVLLYERYALSLGPECREPTACPVGELLFIGGGKNIVSRFATVGDVRSFFETAMLLSYLTLVYLQRLVYRGP